METVVLRTYRFRHEGDIDVAVLDSAGIPSVIVGDDAGGLGAHIMSANPIRLLVAAADLDEAQAALAEEVTPEATEGEADDGAAAE